MRYKLQRLTELVGGVVLRPYMPHGTKWIGEGEGDWAPSLRDSAQYGIYFLSTSRQYKVVMPSQNRI